MLANKIRQIVISLESKAKEFQSKKGASDASMVANIRSATELRYALASEGEVLPPEPEWI